MMLGVSLAVLSGGRSDRMGHDKALMQFLGRPLIMRILDRLQSTADEVVLSSNRPADYAFLDLPIYPDLVPDAGPIGGLYSLFTVCQNPIVAAVACDMPFSSPTLFNYECEILSNNDADVVIPSTPHGLEPLHAVYRRETCLPVIQSALEAGRFKLTGWFSEVKTRIVSTEEAIRVNPNGLAFWNLNTPEDFREAEELAGQEGN